MTKRRSLLLAYVLTNAVLYSVLLPLWEGFDEPFHLGYVQSLANANGFPDPRTSLLSQEIGSSLLLAPASVAVQRNLPETTSYPQFFRLPESRRQQIGRQLGQIDPGLRWQTSHFLNYEGHQAPLAYLALALPERALERLPLPFRVLALRILAGTMGALLLFFGAERLAMQLGIRGPHKEIAIFCAFSSQMIWATLAHVANDWLAVPLSVWLLVMVIHYAACPSPRRAAMAASVLLAGLLTKSYFLAFIPVLLAVFLVRLRWRDFGLGLLVLAFAAPWYVRNVERYGTISGMQELREGSNPITALHSLQLRRLPASIESCARAALWSGNNTFRTFSIKTLRIVILVWLAALSLWVVTRHERAEWIAVLHSGAFLLALAYDTAINYAASHGEASSPAPWYVQVLLVPALALAFLGTSRSRMYGKVVAAAMALLFGYTLVATYWVKLIPLYGGFEGRTSLAAIAKLYWEGSSSVVAGLNQVCIVPGRIILFLSGFVLILVAAQEVIFIRLLLAGERSLSPQPTAPDNGDEPRHPEAQKHGLHNS